MRADEERVNSGCGLGETFAFDPDTDRSSVRESPDGSVRIETYGDPSGRTGGRVRLVRRTQ